MYLIFNESKLIGYTYNKLALATLLKLNKDSIKGKLSLTVKEVDDKNLPFKEGVVKSESHIENLVNWYESRGNWGLWKYIQYDRSFITKFSYSFMYKFERLMFDLEVKDLFLDLDELLNNLNNM